MFIAVTGNELRTKLKELGPKLIGADAWKQGSFWEMEEATIFVSDIFKGRPVSTWHENKSGAVVLEGEIYNASELGLDQEKSLAKGLWLLYQRSGPDFIHTLNGAFSILIWDAHEKRLFVMRDHVGVLQCFYSQCVSDVGFSSNPRILSRMMHQGQLEPEAVLKYLEFCYNPGEQTFYKGVKRVRPGHWMQWHDSKLSSYRFWELVFTSEDPGSEAILAEALREKMADAVRLRMRSGKTGAFLSGGLDSSGIVSLLAQEGQSEIETFSFRCKGESFDESHYAKMVADAFGTHHHLVEYGAEDILLTEEMVGLMDEPFCDVGINVATYLLSRQAGGAADVLFTGDGGDELFAGHPVYMADKVGAIFGLIPGLIRNPVFAFGRRLPDSEQKKDWKVKLKRFSESFAFPEALGTHRWRAYYMPEELNELVSTDYRSQFDTEYLFDDMIRYNQESMGPDAISRSLSSDYQTVVQFYLRRMEMPRGFGLEPRFPMLDPKIVEYCATIPSKYKIRGFSDTKYIERLMVDPLLPHDVVYRKDKLGHSIPLKNWIREHEKAKAFVFDLVSDETVLKRGIFNVDPVRKMKEEHLNKTRNHSHRLWALAVLELWLRHQEK